MRNFRTLFAVGISAGLLLATVSAADARWYHRGYYGRGPGLVGGVVIGALTLATLPFAIVGSALAPPPPPPPYYRPRPYGYGPPPGYYRGYGPPPPPPGYYGY